MHREGHLKPGIDLGGRGISDQIVDVAMQLAAEEGLAATNISRVRAAADVTTGQMRRHFPNRQSLVRAMIMRQTDAVFDAHRLAAVASLDTIAALERWGDMLIAQLAEQDCHGGCKLGSLASQLTYADPEAVEDMAHAFERWLDLLRCGLTSIRDRGELIPDADPEELAVALLAIVQGGMMLAQVRRDVSPLRTAVDVMLAHVRSFTPGNGRSLQHI